jgi:hypothetical protein
MAAAVTVGCGGKKTYSTPGGEVTVEGNGDAARVTMRTDQGDTSFATGQKISEREIGIPFYPGAEVSHSGTRSATEEVQARSVSLTTSDSVDEVKAFYQKKFTKAQTTADVTTEDSRAVSMMLEKGDTQKIVMISRKKGADETTIVLHRSQRTK